MNAIRRCFSFAELLSAKFPSCSLDLFTNNVLSGYVCCSWMCLDVRDCFFQNFKPFGVSDLLGERIPVFSVHRVHRSTHEVWKARMWLAATHYFESEIINKLITHIKIRREAIKSKTLGGNILIKCSLFIAFDSLYCTKTAKPGIYSTAATTVCWCAV